MTITSGEEERKVERKFDIESPVVFKTKVISVGKT